MTHASIVNFPHVTVNVYFSTRGILLLTGTMRSVHGNHTAVDSLATADPSIVASSYGIDWEGPVPVAMSTDLPSLPTLEIAPEDLQIVQDVDPAVNDGNYGITLFRMLQDNMARLGYWSWCLS